MISTFDVQERKDSAYTDSHPFSAELSSSSGASCANSRYPLILVHHHDRYHHHQYDATFLLIRALFKSRTSISYHSSPYIFFLEPLRISRPPTAFPHSDPHAPGSLDTQGDSSVYPTCITIPLSPPPTLHPSFHFWFHAFSSHCSPLHLHFSFSSASIYVFQAEPTHHGETCFMYPVMFYVPFFLCLRLCLFSLFCRYHRVVLSLSLSVPSCVVKCVLCKNYQLCIIHFSCIFFIIVFFFLLSRFHSSFFVM